MAIKMSKKKSKPKKINKKVVSTRKSAKAKNKAKSNVKLTYPKGDYTNAVGRRKVATARVRLYESKGDFIVNDQLVGDYFSGVLNAPKIYNEPFELTQTKGKFAVTVQVSGSGVNAQIEALRHGISRALVSYNPEYKSVLKEAGFLTRDDRMKETRKIGMGGKARRQRQSPKR